MPNELPQVIILPNLTIIILYLQKAAVCGVTSGVTLSLRWGGMYTFRWIPPPPFSGSNVTRGDPHLKCPAGPAGHTHIHGHIHTTYTYIYTCIHTYIHTRTCVHIHIHTHGTLACTCIYVHTSISTRTYVHRYTYIHTYTHVHAHVHMRTCTYTQPHAHTQTCSYTCKHIHTHPQCPPPPTTLMRASPPGRVRGEVIGRDKMQRNLPPNIQH